MDEAQLIERMTEMEQKIQALQEKLAKPAAGDDMKELLSGHGRLRRPVELWQQYMHLSAELGEVKTLAAEDKDEEVRALADEEVIRLDGERAAARAALCQLINPAREQQISRDAVLEIRAGTGGEEGAIFAADLLRMYARYAATKGWEWQPVRISRNEGGGCREAIVMIGGGSYGLLAAEAGVHRVQRVPKTEAQGRTHTSTCSVVVLPQPETPDEVELPAEDLRIDTFRASGAGGQHVNKTDSAVRITHLPSGISVECQEDRSQHRNRTLALAILSARLLQNQLEQQQEEREEQRRNMVAGAKRAEKIRTYNFARQSITDHRLKKSFHRLPEVMDGDLDELLMSYAEGYEGGQSQG